jgi:hypothetical protein
VESRRWTFVRPTERLELRQSENTGTYRLTVDCNGSPRSYEFSNEAEVTRFQADMEVFLLNTGWTFLDFSPDRRRGRDRRGFPRIEERRRWWTDGVQDLKKVVWGG